MDKQSKEILHSEAVNRLWDALRMEACSTKLKAQRIVVVHKEDISRALKRMEREGVRMIQGEEA